MAGVGSNYIGLDKGWKVLSTYNSSSANGVTIYRCVKTDTTNGTIDLQTTAASGALTIGVVQEAVDQTKVATGDAVANVRMSGTTKVYVAASPGTINLGTKVMASAAGGVIAAATSGSAVLGICVGKTGTVAAGDIIDVLLTPGLLVA